jgi:hypothetical protein
MSVIVGLHGTFIPGARIRQQVPGGPHSEDAYSLIVKRSIALGFVEVGDATGRGQWGHEDAGGPLDVNVDNAEVIWLQAHPLQRRLPIAAMASVLDDVLGHVGTFDFTGFHLFADVDDFDSARLDNSYQAAWFRAEDPQHSMLVDVLLHLAGQGSDGAAELAENVQANAGEQVVLRRSDVASSSADKVRSETRVWTELPQQARFTAEIGGWSVDRAAWLATLCLDAAGQTGHHGGALIKLAARGRAKPAPT